MPQPGETWVVTGASKGIGLAYITQVLAAGANAVAAVRSPKMSADLQSLQTKYPEALTIVAMDTSVFSSVKDAAKEVEQAHLEGIDFLIANAGVGTIRSDVNTPNLELAPEEFDEVFHVNVAGVFATIQAFYPLLKKKEGGRKTVLTMSSAAAIMSGASIGSRDPEAPFNYADGVMVAYKASKSALNQVTMQLAQSLKSEGFTFIAIHPGLVETDLAKDLVTRVKGLVGEETAAASYYISPEVSVQKQLAYLSRAKQATHNGRFVNNTGEDLPW